MKSVLVAIDFVLWLAVAAAAVMGALNFFPLVFLDAARTEGNIERAPARSARRLLLRLGDCSLRDCTGVAGAR